MTNYPLVTIIFPNHNGGTQPLDCLASIKTLTYPKDKIEVIIIDNNSIDESDLQIKKKFPWTRLYKMKTNLGFARAINIGIKHAQGKYVFIGNDDLVFEKNSLKVMMGYLLSHPDVGLIGGKIYYKYNPTKIASCGYLMNKWTGNVYKAPEPDKLKEPDWVQGCALLVPKKIITKIGKFDPQYEHLFEDFDFALRIKRIGYKVIYLPRAIFWHAESTTANKNKSLKYFHWYKSKFRFLIKNFPLFNILSIFFVQILIITPYRAIFLHDRRLKPFLKGFFWNIKNLKTTLSVRKN